MKIHVDLESLELIEGAGFRNPVTALRFKRGDAARLEVVFLRAGTTPVAIGAPGSLEIRFGVKPRTRYDVGYLVHSDDWTIPALNAESQVYLCSPSFNTVELDSALGVGSSTGSELSEITLMGEITWREGSGEPTSTRTFLVVVENDVNRGTEGVPESATPAYPAPDAIALLSSVVRHDVAQSLAEEQKQQARENIGAMAAGAVAGLQLLHKEPSELTQEEQAMTCLLVKAQAVWLHDATEGDILLTEPAVLPIVFQEQFTTPLAGTSTYGQLMEIPPGTYLLTVSAANFTTTYWGSHSMQLAQVDPVGTFSSPDTGSLYGLTLLTEEVGLHLLLADPASAQNPQQGTAVFYTTTPATLQLGGYLPSDNASADFTFTFTQI